ncbi:hypothetical protein [Streptomyces sp. NPDC017988]|uniref:hypothetical protein n=1 Tax=Streptomyces sp. NPDC017988 TaxID=3365025 RepID=UPI00378A9752
MRHLELWRMTDTGVIAYIRSGTLYLQPRRGGDLSPAFPDLVAAATRVEEDPVLDGELVVIQGGRLDFAALQPRARLMSLRGGVVEGQASSCAGGFPDLVATVGRGFVGL